MFNIKPEGTRICHPLKPEGTGLLCSQDVRPSFITAKIEYKGLLENMTEMLALTFSQQIKKNKNLLLYALCKNEQDSTSSLCNYEQDFSSSLRKYEPWLTANEPRLLSHYKLDPLFSFSRPFYPYEPAVPSLRFTQKFEPAKKSVLSLQIGPKFIELNLSFPDSCDVFFPDIYIALNL
ncbi:hypothetical protein P8452_50698 [Trifolium repens]|nr:hypothetical protein P8452_50698 [Trifolium repens]